MNPEIHYSRVEVAGRNMPKQTVEPPSLQSKLEASSMSPELFREALERERPEGLDWDRIDAAVAVLKGEKEVKPVEPEPTESQKFWRKMFDNGDQVLYNREKGPIKFDALKLALTEASRDLPTFIKNFGSHVHAIDTDFRGGRDAGDAKERLQRVGSLLGVLALFTAFDWGTSKAVDGPFNKIFPLEGKTDTQYLAMRGGLRKIIEVMNDKYASVLGNMLVEHLTGKRGFIHEVADKGADTITVGIDGWDDWVNGSSLESAQRIAFQIPIAGALLEQGLTRLSMFQEKSPLHTVTGKMFYMGLGVYLRTMGVGKKGGDESLEAAIQTAT